MHMKILHLVLVAKQQSSKKPLQFLHHIPHTNLVGIYVFKALEVFQSIPLPNSHLPLACTSSMLEILANIGILTIIINNGNNSLILSTLLFYFHKHCSVHCTLCIGMAESVNINLAVDNIIDKTFETSVRPCITLIPKGVSYAIGSQFGTMPSVQFEPNVTTLDSLYFVRLFDGGVKCLISLSGPESLGKILSMTWPVDNHVSLYLDNKQPSDKLLVKINRPLVWIKPKSKVTLVQVHCRYILILHESQVLAKNTSCQFSKSNVPTKAKKPRRCFFLK